MVEFKYNEAALANLKGKVAIVTGGSSGIGRGAVEYFTSLGCKVVAADVNEGPLGKPALPMPENATFHKCNVKNWSEIVILFREAKKMHGKIDIVCANAGINDRVNFLADNEDEPIWDVLDVDLKGVMMTIKAAAYHFRRNTPQGGVVIATASITSFVPAHEGVYVYPAAKYGVLGCLRNMRTTFPKFNSRINVVAPYLTDTGMRQEKDPSVDFYRGQPTNKPNAIAKAMAALAADETKNGTTRLVVSLIIGNAVVCVGDRYYESEETYWKILPQMVSEEVTENWAKVLMINPFKHMAD